MHSSMRLCTCLSCAYAQFEEVQVSRFLVYMEASGLPFRLLFNKADLVPPEVLAQRVQQVKGW